MSTNPKPAPCASLRRLHESHRRADRFLHPRARARRQEIVDPEQDGGRPRAAQDDPRRRDGRTVPNASAAVPRKDRRPRWRRTGRDGPPPAPRRNAAIDDWVCLVISSWLGFALASGRTATASPPHTSFAPLVPKLRHRRRVRSLGSPSRVPSHPSIGRMQKRLPTRTPSTSIGPASGDSRRPIAHRPIGGESRDAGGARASPAVS